MGLYKKAAEYLRKGYIITDEKCPKCGSILLKNPKTKIALCSSCDYKESLKDILIRKKGELIVLLKKEKDPRKIYFITKSLLYIEKLLKND